MSGKHKSEKVEELKPKLDTEISTFWITKDIPDVVWQKIFGFFSLKEIKLNVARVCRHFYEISNDCVKEITIDRNICDSNSMYEMFDALPTFQYLKTIKIINFSVQNPSTKVAELFVMHALRNCPRLKILRLIDFQMSIGFMEHIVKHGQNLVGLQLNFMRTGAPDILSPLNTGMKNLKHLELHYFWQSNYKTEDLLAMVQNCKKLNSLHLYGCQVPDDTISQLINLKKEKLKEFKFRITQDFIGCSEKWIEQLIHCPKLEYLNVIGLQITKYGFEVISNLKSLVRIDLHSDAENQYKADDVIKLMSNGKFNNLKELRVWGLKDTIDSLLMCVAFACPNLTFLKFECSTDTRKYFPKNIIKVLFDILPELKELELEWNWDEEHDNSGDGPIFVKSQLEEMLINFKNKFKVEIGEDYDDLIKITREM